VTAEHVLFIPGVLFIGLTLGYMMGARAVRKEIEKARASLRE
jgi:hypothetical protein